VAVTTLFRVKLKNIGTNALALGLVAAAVALLVFKRDQAIDTDAKVRLLNVSYDPTRELYAQLAIVYPPVSIRAEPSVAVVSINVAKHHTEATARAYLNFLFSDAAQGILANDGDRAPGTLPA
jgi:ABC-type sulfate transport system substrate-binding protein